MEANKILNADILDILFEGKNKDYGAYQLRKSYNNRLLKALAVTGVILALVLIGIFVSAKIDANKKEVFEVTDASLAEVKKDEPPPVVPPPPPPKPPPPPEIKQIQFTPPVIKKDNEIKKPEEIKEIEEDAAISTQTVVTENTKQVVQAPVEVKESQVAAAPVKVVEEDQIFQKVEIDADFPGGMAAFRKYLEKNLNSNTPADNGAAAGSYTCIVRFVVMKDGSINDVVAETDPGFGCAAEAVKIIKKSLKWKPGIQNGTNVSSVKRQPITFVVAEE